MLLVVVVLDVRLDAVAAARMSARAALSIALVTGCSGCESHVVIDCRVTGIWASWRSS